MSANWPTIHHALTRQKGWARRRGAEEEREAEGVACSIVAMCSGSRKNKMPTSQQFRMLWCGAQNPPQVAPLQISPPPPFPLLSHPVLDSCNASKHFNQTGCKKCPTKKGRTQCAEREWAWQREGGREFMGQLNDAYKLPASALNAFVSMSLPRHELRFTHSHSHSPSLHSHSHSHSVIHFASFACKGDVQKAKQFARPKWWKRRETTETSCSREWRAERVGVRERW